MIKMRKIILIAFLFVGCAHMDKTKTKGELWLIDDSKIELFRSLDDGYQQRVPIKDNTDMSKFICMDVEYYKDVSKSGCK